VIAIKMLREREASGVIKESYAVYWNSWFLVKKKDLGYRLINNISKGNRVIIKDTFISLVADKFVEKFIMYKILSFLDFFLGYN
jgi:hypothetical protein